MPNDARDTGGDQHCMLSCAVTLITAVVAFKLFVFLWEVFEVKVIHDV